MGIWSLIARDDLRHQKHPVLYLPLAHMQGYTYIYFRESQLSPGSIGILPLTTSRLIDL